MIQQLKHYIGLFLMILGTLALALTQTASLANSNTLLATGLLLIVAGILWHIHSIKRESKY